MDENISPKPIPPDDPASRDSRPSPLRETPVIDLDQGAAKKRERGIWASTPDSGKLVCLLLAMSCVCSQGVKKDPENPYNVILPIIGVVGYSIALVGSILELCGVRDSKGRKLPSVLALLISASILVVVGLAFSGFFLARSTEPIINNEHSFRVDWPGEGWGMMSPTEAKQADPDALAGAFHHGTNTVGMVFVVPGVEDCEGVGRAMIAGSPWANTTEHSFEKTAYMGFPAVRYHISGVAAKDGKLRRLQDTVFAVNGKLYVLRVIGMDSPAGADGSLARRFVSSFSLTFPIPANSK